MPPTKLELTFKKYVSPRKGGRWLKKIDGKTHYFGTGKSRSDLTSYRSARAAYHRYRDQDMAALQVQQMARAFFRGKSQAELEAIDEKLIPTSAAQIEGALAGWKSVNVKPAPESQQPSLDELLAMIHRTAIRATAVRKAVLPHAQAKSINDHIDDWLQAEKGRWDSGEITEVGYYGKQQGIKTMRDFVGKQSFGDAEQVEVLLADYRVYVLGQQQKGRFSGNTVNDKTKFLRQFIKWCYQRRVLSEMPRILDQVVKRVAVKTGGQPLTKEEVLKLWTHADERLRCWMALGLNCGFKNRDVAELRGCDIVDGRLIGRRHKTDVPLNMKLWPATAALIEKTRQNRNDSQARLFVNKQGLPVTRDRSDNLGSAFRKLTTEADVTATFERLRDTGAEYIRSWTRQQHGIDQAVIQLYLAHKDVSTAKFYLSDKPEDVQAQVLDDATDALKDWLALK